MTDPRSYRPAPGTIPTAPGVYRFRDSDGRVIYVGKAKNLRNRLSNYFQDLPQLHPRTRQMVTTANSVEWTVVANDVEALQLEYTWIKKYDPYFNVKYRDDKSYPVLAVSTGQRFPRAFFYRGKQRKGVRYFGPYSHAWAVRETLDALTRVFPVRTCTQTVFRRHEAMGRPCLLGYIDKCAAPCIGRVTESEYRDIVQDFCQCLAGKTDPVLKQLRTKMEAAAEDLDFEQAARIRDDIAAIELIAQRQAIVLGDGTDADMVAVVADELEAAIELFQVRAGRVLGQRGWVVERSDDTPEELQELLQGFLVQFYDDALEFEQATAQKEAKAIAAAQPRSSTEIDRAPEMRTGRVHSHTAQVIPRNIYTNIALADAELPEVLAKMRQGPVQVRQALRGDKRKLLETVEENATETLRQHKLTRVGDMTTRAKALQELQDALFMDEAPLRIECTDISHIQGTDVVASLVVFEDGLPKKSDYRKYQIRDEPGNDVASIAEVVRRRFLRYQENKHAMPETEATAFADDERAQAAARSFAYAPQLFIVDGGAPQVAAAQAVLDELGISDVTLVGIAKRLEEIWVPGDPEPVILPRNSQAMYLVQQIRDEAHRTAISYHRSKRNQRMQRSQLDDIPGLGPARRKALVRHFGSLKNLKAASVEQIQEVPGFGASRASQIFAALHDQKPDKTE